MTSIFVEDFANLNNVFASPIDSSFNLLCLIVWLALHP